MGRLAFVATFFGLILLPVLQMATGLIPEHAIDENRRAAPAPTRETPADQFLKIADNWFGDHFGLRPLLIRTKTQIDFSIFGLSDRVLVGFDGQLFYRNTVNIEPPAVEHLLASKNDVAVRGIGRLGEMLKRHGIGLVMTVNMMSDRFYPELLPRSALRRPINPRIDHFVSEVRNLPHVGFVDSTAILRAAMTSRRVFHRTDFHWNDPAAFDVAKAITDYISTKEGRPTSPWVHPLEIETKPLSGGIAMFIPLFVPPSEQALFVRANWIWPKGMTQQVNSGPFEHIASFEPNKRLLPPTVLIGDSFLDGMIRSGLQANFVETRRIRWRPGLKVSEIVSSLPPNTQWLVLQFIEVNITAINALADEDDIIKAAAILDARQQAAQSTRR